MLWFAAAWAAAPVLTTVELTERAMVHISVAHTTGEQVCRRLVRTRSPLVVRQDGAVWEASLGGEDVPETACRRVVEGAMWLGPFEPGSLSVRTAGEVAVVLASVPVLDDATDGMTKVLEVQAVVPSQLLLHLTRNGRGEGCEEAVEASVNEARHRIFLGLEPELDGRCARGDARDGWTRLSVDRGSWRLKARGAAIERGYWVGAPAELARHVPAEEQEP